MVRGTKNHTRCLYPLPSFATAGLSVHELGRLFDPGCSLERSTSPGHFFVPIALLRPISVRDFAFPRDVLSAPSVVAEIATGLSQSPTTDLKRLGLCSHLPVTTDGGSSHVLVSHDYVRFL